MIKLLFGHYAKRGIHRSSMRWIEEGVGEIEFFKRWRELYSKNKERVKVYTSRFKASDGYKNKRNAWAKAYRDKNPEKVRATNRESYHRHGERRREDARRQRQQIKLDPLRLSAHRMKVTARVNKRARTDLHFRIAKRLRGRIKQAIAANYRTGSGLLLLGCSVDEFRAHMEKLWLPGMNWDNYGRGGWEIDHIKPCAWFDLSKPEQQKACFHFSNTRPLWAVDNHSQGALVRRKLSQ